MFKKKSKDKSKDKEKKESASHLPSWVIAQKKAFYKWVNVRLQSSDAPPGEIISVDSIETAWDNGLNLFRLLKNLYPEKVIPLPKFNKKPRLRAHKLDNITIALKLLEEKCLVPVPFLKSVHLIDHDLKMILGMIWAIILHSDIGNISHGELKAKDALLSWTTRIVSKGSGGILTSITNFEKDWNDGKAFAALLQFYLPQRPGLFAEINALGTPEQRLERVMAEADGAFHITRLLDIEDFLCSQPDEKAIMTYIASYYHTLNTRKRTLETPNAVEVEDEDDEVKEQEETKEQAVQPAIPPEEKEKEKKKSPPEKAKKSAPAETDASSLNELDSLKQTMKKKSKRYRTEKKLLLETHDKETTLLKAQIETLKHDHADEVKELQGKVSTSSNDAGSIAFLQQKIVTLEEELTQNRSKLLDENENKILKLKKDHVLELNTLKEEHKKDILLLHQKHDKNILELRENTENSLALKDKISFFESEKKALKEQSDQKIEELQTQINLINIEKDKMEKISKEKEATATQALDQLKKLESETEAIYGSKLKANENEKLELETKFKGIESDLQSKLKTIESQRLHEIQMKENEIRTIQSSKRDLETSKLDLESKLKTYDNKVIQLEGELENFKTEKEKEKEKEDGGKEFDQTIIKLRDDIATKNQVITQLGKDMTTKNQVITQMEQDMTTKNQVIAQMEQDLTTKNQVIAQMEQDLTTKNQVITQMEQDMTTKISQMEQDIEIKNQTIAKMEDMATEISQMKQDIETKNKVTAKMNEDLTDKNQTIFTLKGEVDSISTKNEALEVEIKKLGIKVFQTENNILNDHKQAQEGDSKLFGEKLNLENELEVYKNKFKFLQKRYKEDEELIELLNTRILSLTDQVKDTNLINIINTKEFVHEQELHEIEQEIKHDEEQRIHTQQNEIFMLKVKFNLLKHQILKFLKLHSMHKHKGETADKKVQTMTFEVMDKKLLDNKEEVTMKKPAIPKAKTTTVKDTKTTNKVKKALTPIFKTTQKRISLVERNSSSPMATPKRALLSERSSKSLSPIARAKKIPIKTVTAALPSAKTSTPKGTIRHNEFRISVPGLPYEARRFNPTVVNKKDILLRKKYQDLLLLHDNSITPEGIMEMFESLSFKVLLHQARKFILDMRLGLASHEEIPERKFIDSVYQYTLSHNKNKELELKNRQRRDNRRLAKKTS